MRAQPGLGMRWLVLATLLGACSTGFTGGYTGGVPELAGQRSGQLHMYGRGGEKDLAFTVGGRARLGQSMSGAVCGGVRVAVPKWRVGAGLQYQLLVGRPFRGTWMALIGYHGKQTSSRISR